MQKKNLENPEFTSKNTKRDRVRKAMGAIEKKID